IGSTTAVSLKNLLTETGVNADLVLVKSSEEGFQALNEAKIDAFSADQVVLIGLAMASARPRDYRVSPDLFTYEPFALAVRKNDSDFRLVADTVIARLYRTGNIFQIHDKWFGQFAKQRSSAFQALIQINAIPE
ncbi:MAG: transporter substrate-binding domain-containing protein, partial [Deltaproteobacteria bacterium]|nr:transporter substrate-binding domain-containing protein [Deltaproteobacteria bacterium]